MSGYSPLARGVWSPQAPRSMSDEELAGYMDEARDARIARAGAEAANHAKGRLIAQMGHEIATPLNAIGGHVQLITMGVYGPLSDELRAALGRIERAQRHLVRLSNDLLNFARLDSGHLEYRLERVLLGDLSADLEPMIEPQARAKRLSLSFQLDGDVAVTGDRDKLMQVMLNLLSNAVKFTPPDGAIVVDAPHRADGSMDPHLSHIRVRNDCEGIATEKLDAIFQPFVQLEGTQGTKLGGAGLGLSISRELMLGMGGHVRARSDPGHVSITLTLPTRPLPSAARD